MWQHIQDGAYQGTNMSGPFNPAIPVGTDAMQLSCQQLRGNFTQIFNAFAENHLPLNDGNQGMHSQLELVQQSGDPTTGSDEVALYSKSGTGSQPQIFFMPASSGTPIQISNNKVISTGPYYQSFMAGPYVVLFGKVLNYTNTQTFTYSTYYPLITALSEVEFVDLQIIQSVKPIPPTSTANPYNVGTTSFQVALSLLGLTMADLFYLIVGKP